MRIYLYSLSPSERSFRAYARNIALDSIASTSMGSAATGDVTFSNAPDSSGPESVVPKLEPDRDGYDSPSASSMDDEPEGGALPEKIGADPPPVPKRKGGRKPVCAPCARSCTCLIDSLCRSMQHQKSESNAIGRHRRLSVNAEPSTSSN